MAYVNRGRNAKRVQMVMGKRPIDRFRPGAIIQELAKSITTYSALMMKFGATLPTVQYKYSTQGPYKFIEYKMRFNMDQDMFEYFNQTTAGFTP